jgi:hypothetical protein
MRNLSRIIIKSIFLLAGSLQLYSAYAVSDYNPPCAQLSKINSMWSWTSDNTDGFQSGTYNINLHPSINSDPGSVVFQESVIKAPNGEKYQTSYPMSVCLFQRFHLEWNNDLTSNFNLKYVLDGSIPSTLTQGTKILLTGTLIKTLKDTGQVIKENLTVNASYQGNS